MMKVKITTKGIHSTSAEITTENGDRIGGVCRVDISMRPGVPVMAEIELAPVALELDAEGKINMPYLQDCPDEVLRAIGGQVIAELRKRKLY